MKQEINKRVQAAVNGQTAWWATYRAAVTGRCAYSMAYSDAAARLDLHNVPC
jgi:hypothetical protein